MCTNFDDIGGWTAPLLGIAKRLIAISPQQGADTLVYLAASPDIAGVNGEYFSKRKIEAPSEAACNEAAARRLWEISEKLAASA